MKRCMGCMEEYHESEYICPICGYGEDTKPLEVYHMEPGSILGGKYIVGKALGWGGFGVTYIGYDAELERKVAIKEYLPGEFSTRIPGQTQVTVYDGEKGEQFQSGIEKFLDEAKRLAKFQDTDGIVHIYDSFFENETAYIVMEYIEGESLKERLDREGKLSLEDALDIVIPITSALKEVHKVGIIHRDIAPDNIMLGKDGRVSLIDFGASRFATTAHSKSLSVLIKQGYAPIEQYQSRGEQGSWTDVYALAATLYKMLTGLEPIDSMERRGGTTLKSPSKAGANVSKNVDTAIMNALNLKVEDRTRTMEAFEQELLSTSEVVRLTVRKEKNDIGRWPLWAKIVMPLAGVVAVGTVVLAVLFDGSGGGLVDVGKLIKSDEVYVPNMVNSTILEAQTAAEEKKLGVQITGKEYSKEIPADKVLSQSVDGGKTVKVDTVLDLVVSGGVEMVKVPSVTGLEKEQAIALLEAAGLTYKLQEIESMVAVDAVVSQSKTADVEVEKGTEIILEISIGMEVDTTVEVTMIDVQGMDYDEALNKLADLGLSILKSKEIYSDTVGKGKIIEQSVPAGTSMQQGDTVEVVVSLGKEMATVPDVMYKSEKEAKSALEEAKLNVKVMYAYSDIVAEGKVVSQSIVAKEIVNLGTEVTIVVSKGKEPEPEKKEEQSQHTHNYNWSVGVTKEATCTAEGQKTYTCSCGASKTESIPAKGHTVVKDAAVAATCTATGKTEGSHCSVCGTVIVAQTTVAAKGHTEVTVAGQAATCTATGLTDGKKCSVCGTVTQAQTTVAAKGHTEVIVAGKAATCTATGLTDGKKCSVCGIITVEQTIIGAKGHTYDGQYDGYCNICNAQRSITWGAEYESTDGTANELRRVNSYYDVPAVTHEEIDYYTYSCYYKNWGVSGPDSSAGSNYYEYKSDSQLSYDWVTLSSGAKVKGYKAGVGVYLFNETPHYKTVVDQAAYRVYRVQDGYYN